MRMRSCLLIVATLQASAAAAAPPTESFESIEVDCASAPAGAVMALPPTLAQWAALSCIRYGRVVRAAPAWAWHAPRTDEFVRVWSQPSQHDLEDRGHADHFTSITFEQLGQEKAEKADEALAEHLGAKPQPVFDAHVALLRDARGGAQAIYFVRTQANARLGNFWGWSCRYPCSKPQVFMGIKSKP